MKRAFRTIVKPSHVPGNTIENTTYGIHSSNKAPENNGDSGSDLRKHSSSTSKDN